MIILPDIHGREFWRKPVEENLGKEHILFLGDYLDPYDYEYIYPRDAYEVFVDILELKIAHPLDITLLLGNHDLHYLDPIFDGSRKDYLRAERIREKLEQNGDLFDIAKTAQLAGKQFLFTHAGVKQGWLEYNKDLFDRVNTDAVGNCLNSLWHMPSKRLQLIMALAQVSASRWGECPYGSPVWNDIEDMVNDPDELPGWYQIFGHSQQAEDPVIGEHIACLDCRRAFRLNKTTGDIEEIL